MPSSHGNLDIFIRTRIIITNVPSSAQRTPSISMRTHEFVQFLPGYLPVEWRTGHRHHSQTLCSKALAIFQSVVEYKTITNSSDVLFAIYKIFRFDWYSRARKLVAHHIT